MQAKHIMCNIDLIIARTFNDTFTGLNWEELFEEWSDAFEKFKIVNEMHQSRFQFTDKILDEYHKKANDFFVLGLT